MTASGRTFDEHEVNVLKLLMGAIYSYSRDPSRAKWIVIDRYFLQVMAYLR